MVRRPDRAWFAPAVVALISLTVFVLLSPDLVFKATTPTGGDMGAHVLGPAFLRDVLLPSGRLHGWSNEWFAGFPIYYFYFPLPSLVIVLLDLFLPYGVAFKLVVIAGLIATPAACYSFVRAMRFDRFVAALGAAAGLVFITMESYTIYGGNIASTMAGEFSYAWSFALGLWFLATLIRAVREDRRYVPISAAFLAATALCHILTVVVLVAGSAVLLLWRRAWVRVLQVWAIGFAIAGFWAVPLVARIGLTSDMAWSPLGRWEEVFPVEIWLLLPLAVAGAVWAARKTIRVQPLIVMTLIPLIYYPLPNLLKSLMPGVFGDFRFKLWNGRLLPYWYFGVTLLAAIAIGGFLSYAARRLPEKSPRWWAQGLLGAGGMIAASLLAFTDLETRVPGWSPWVALLVFAGFAFAAGSLPKTIPTRAVLAGGMAAVLCLGSLSAINFVTGWARWNFSGYEGKTVWPEYDQLMTDMAALPDGRVMWEANNDMNKYGTPMALMLFPYWAPGHPSFEGLYFESSLTTPFHFLTVSEMSSKPSNPIPGLHYHTFDMERGIRHLQVMGGSYFVSYTEDAAKKAEDMGLTKLADATPWSIFALPETSLVEPLTNQPAVFSAVDDGPSDFHDFALDWFDDMSALDTVVVKDGPASWPRVGTVDQLATTSIPGAGGAVSNLEVDDMRISFHTTAVGIPHLIKVSYFPNWKAEGAEGPWRATPSFMVVVPTQEDVVIAFRNTWAETGGDVLSLLGLVVVGGWLWRSRRQEPANLPHTAEGAGDPGEE